MAAWPAWPLHPYTRHDTFRPPPRALLRDRDAPRSGGVDRRGASAAACSSPLAPPSDSPPPVVILCGAVENIDYSINGGVHAAGPAFLNQVVVLACAHLDAALRAVQSARRSRRRVALSRASALQARERAERGASLLAGDNGCGPERAEPHWGRGRRRWRGRYPAGVHARRLRRHGPEEAVTVLLHRALVERARVRDVDVRRCFSARPRPGSMARARTCACAHGSARRARRGRWRARARHLGVLVGDFSRAPDAQRWRRRTLGAARRREPLYERFVRAHVRGRVPQGVGDDGPDAPAGHEQR